MKLRSFAILSILSMLALGTGAQAQSDPEFDVWLSAFKARALQQGISPKTLEDAFTDITPDPVVVRLDRKQPESKITLSKYLENTVTDGRIARGQAKLGEYADSLSITARRYGVQSKYIIALWGIESDYGRQQGNFSVIRSLATLAYEGRRAEFFGKELIAALRILEAENMSASELRGSWAGAMGNCQFMPSTYLEYAVDGNGDGHRDIWNNELDAFASIANYLNALGWDDSLEWGHRVQVPSDFTAEEASIKHGHSGRHWRKRGLKYMGEPITDTASDLYAIYPGMPDEGVILVTNNFRALLNWNRSRYFATAVGNLADTIGDY